MVKCDGYGPNQSNQEATPVNLENLKATLKWFAATQIQNSTCNNIYLTNH